MKVLDASKALSLFSGIAFNGRLESGCPMSKYSSFRIGGPAAALLHAACTEDINLAIAVAEENGLPFFVLGNGSNVLFPDEGFPGIVIRLAHSFAGISVDGVRVTAQAGALLPKIASSALEHSLAGFEFASGIPGSAGGALVMNAGAYGKEMSDIVAGAKLLRAGKVVDVSLAELDLRYRHSAVMGTSDIVLEVSYALQKGDRTAIRQRMDELKSLREEKQPVNLPSAGSAFKRPVGAFAAKLIDDCGLKGFSVGGAQISPKHAGFIVNTGGATAQDVIKLSDMVIEKVQMETGFLLEREFIVVRA